jgi:hypothetical protein
LARCTNAFHTRCAGCAVHQRRVTSCAHALHRCRFRARSLA